jgi:hypothetical protein
LLNHWLVASAEFARRIEPVNDYRVRTDSKGKMTVASRL